MYRILLAEDNPGDVRLFREALSGRRLDFELIVVEDGQQALQFVRTADGHKLPHIIVLDINLPKHNGEEVLLRIRALPNWVAIPVIVLTSSESPTDRARLVELGANLYLRKPSDLEGLMQIGNTVEGMLRAGNRPTSSSD